MQGILICNSVINGSNSNEKEAIKFLKSYNVRASDVKYKNAIAEWNYDTNITNQTQKRMVSAMKLYIIMTNTC